MRWLVIYLLILALIWLFITDKTWRRGLLATVTVAFGVFMLALSLTEDPNQANTDAGTSQELNQTRQREAIQYGALTAKDIAIGATSITNPNRTVFDSQGRELIQPELDKWQLQTTLTNRSDKYAARAVVMQFQVYSCPVFYKTPQSEITLESLAANCTSIASKSFQHGNQSIEPGKSVNVETVIVFSDRPEPRNPRYWLSVQSVSAIQAAGS